MKALMIGIGCVGTGLIMIHGFIRVFTCPEVTYLAYLIANPVLFIIGFALLASFVIYAHTR